jgi:serine-type D-Ala-D-Ala carboxypeptidase/endopeptidase (penicillin-binding protein 4)
MQDQRLRVKPVNAPAPLCSTIPDMKPALRFLFLLLVVCHPGCARRMTAPPAPFSTAGPDQQLRAKLDRIFSDQRFSRTLWGIQIISLDRPETLYEMNPQRLLIPASCNKLITVAAALTRLGPDYRYETRVMTDGRIDAGALKGNLMILGSGDPSGSADFQEEGPGAVFKTWAAALKQRNILKIAGDMVGDDSGFIEPRLGTGWEWNDLSHAYAAPVSALQFNENWLALEITPGEKQGDPAGIRTQPLENYFKIENHISTGPRENPAVIRVTRGDSGETIDVSGTVPAGGNAVVQTVAVRNPTRYYLSALKYYLSADGIDTTSCGVRTAKGNDAFWSLLWTQTSPPLSSIIKPILKNSLNLASESLVRTLGLRFGGEGSFDKGKQVVDETLAKMGFEAGSYSFADGSGLSRLNLESAENFVRLLQLMRTDRNYQQFLDALPVAGVDGTLSARMKGTKAENNVRAKTGSMTNVSSISGYLRTNDGELLAFSVCANNFPGLREPVESAQDKALETLANFSRK